MIIINADDWGASKQATNTALTCFQQRRISSVSAMVFMEDSERAAELAAEVGLDVGLHLNLNHAFSGHGCPAKLVRQQSQIHAFLRRSKYALLFYNPFYRKHFRFVYEAQLQEFKRLYRQDPSHIDGHQHMHLCSNMLLDRIIPRATRVRRSFSFWPGEKSSINRAYRSWVDRQLEIRYQVTDYFFALSQCLEGSRIDRVADLAKTANVELMAHPEKPVEQAFLLSDAFGNVLRNLRMATYAELSALSDARIIR